MRWITGTVIIMLLASCHETVAPKHCEWITQRGLHADTTVMNCTK